jgi:hypothetical protein
MKKLFVSVAAICISVIAAQAQETTVKTEKTNEVHFGIRGGVNVANIIKTDDNNFSTDMKLGFNAAVFLEIPIVNGFSVQPEFQYSQKGYKTSGSYLTQPYEYSVTTNYLEVPLLAKINPTKEFSILIGPQFSFLTSSKYNFKSGGTSYQDIVEEGNDDLRKNILGGVIGVEFNASHIVLGARYNLDFQQNESNGSSTTPTYKNQVIQFTIGLRL